MNKTFTTTELDALAEAFQGWIWGPNSMEPDARIEVLYDEQDTKYPILVRGPEDWYWDAGDDDASVETWDEIRNWMHATRRTLRLPTRDELVAAGWTIEDSSAHETPVEPEETSRPAPEDEVTDHIDRGFYHLNVPSVTPHAATLAQTHFLGAIAILFQELVALHKKYDIDNLKVVVDSGPVSTLVENLQENLVDVNDTEPSPPGPVAGEDFPFAPR